MVMAVLDLRSIHILCALAHNGSVTRAAVELGMSQPATTKALARIEERCGMALFARTRTGIELTKAGRLVFEEVQLRVRGLERLNEAIETIRSGKRGHIRLASIP